MSCPPLQLMSAILVSIINLRPRILQHAFFLNSILDFVFYICCLHLAFLSSFHFYFSALFLTRPHQSGFSMVGGTLAHQTLVPLGSSTFPKMIILNQHYPGIKLSGKQELCKKSGFVDQNPKRANRVQVIKGFWKKIQRKL